MKTILQVLLNLILWIGYITTCSILMIWYGKLPKDSPYDFWNNSSTPKSLFREIKKTDIQ